MKDKMTNIRVEERESMSKLYDCKVSIVFKAKHATPGNHTWGVNGETGKLQDMTDLGVWDTYSVKAQTVKTAIEVTTKSLLYM